ncbi:MAG: VCBS repeat-containing protein, partial [Myxococcota bacterium]
MTDEHTLSGSSPFIGTVLGVIATAALVVSAAPAHAGWPGTRGDSARSGTTTGAASLRNPVPYWRYYLGGSIRTRAALAMDIDGDDEAEMIFVSGGKLVAKERNNVPIWQTSVLGMYELVGVSDLDGDGAEEVIARNQEQLFVVEPGSGTILWQQSADDFGTLGGARIGDLDGDGLDDLFAQECACCRINNGNTGFVYSFADGYAAARKLWTSPEARCGGFRSMTLLDVDGDGAPEVTVGEHRRLLIVDGATGQEIAASPDLGDRTGGAICAPVDADGDGDDELLCAQNDSPVAQPELGHRVFLLDYGAGSLRVRWNRL